MSTKEYQKIYHVKWAEENREKCRKYQADYRLRHPERVIKYAERYRAEHPELIEAYLKKSRELRAKSTRKYMLKKYGLTEESYQVLLESQNGVCAICKSVCSRSKGLSVDHSHETGKVRGLLCSACNLALGNIRENIDSMKNMIKYITDYEKPEA